MTDLWIARRLAGWTETLRGHGLHHGAAASVRIGPGAPGQGIRFRRLDLGGAALVPASLAAARPAARRILLAEGCVEVSTPEHLLAALHALGVIDAEVELTSSELPILDGSAARFLEAIAPVCLETRWPGELVVNRVFACQRGAASCQLSPAPDLRLRARLDFGPGLPGRQSLEWVMGDPELFRRRLAPARTFGLLAEADQLRQQGLARGASLRNVVVYGRGVLLNPEGTRFHDEAVRHKLLDALGGLALLGGRLRGRLILDRCSHALLIATLRAAVCEGAILAPAPSSTAPAL